MKLAIILGTRPEIIKMAPIVRECEKKKVSFFILHTGQHYSKELDEQIFLDLNLPSPKYNLKIGSGKQGEQIGKMIIEIEKILLEEKPNIVLVQGDTNTVLAGALVASHNKINVGHVEAGLRSYDRNMVEEQNRIITDHLADILFVPTSQAGKVLIQEGIQKKRVVLTGNTIVDAVLQNIEIAEKKSNILSRLNLLSKKYILVTSHRAENVDDPKRLANILKSLELVALESHLPILFPMHPRTANRINEFGLSLNPLIKQISPVGFLDFLSLEKNARLILTDSGGAQEEACILNVPCVTLRDNTERPETVEAGMNIVAGNDPVKILEAAKLMLTKNPRAHKWETPFGDGKAAERIISHCTKLMD